MQYGLGNGEFDMDLLKKKEICWFFDSGNLTVAQVASHFGLSVDEVKKVLMDDAFGENE